MIEPRPIFPVDSFSIPVRVMGFLWAIFLSADLIWGGSLYPNRLFPSGIGSGSILNADFNADGFPDLAVANYDGGDISILAGRGDGTFAPPTSFPVGDKPQYLKTADFNHDGNPDLAVVDREIGELSILLGNVDGTFLPEFRLALGIEPREIETEDLNLDGNPDLSVVIANGFFEFNPGEISIRLGGGDGTFGPESRVGVGTEPSQLELADFNHDGAPDLAVTNWGSNDVSVLPGMGDGTFGPQSRYTVGERPGWLAVADFDEDGNLDLIVHNAQISAGHYYSLLFGNGDGTFQPEVVLAPPLHPLQGVTAADFNGDGHQDLIELVGGVGKDQGVQIRHGNGDGTFSGPVHTVGGGNWVSGMTLGDWNGDGNTDAALSHPGYPQSGHISVLMNGGSGLVGPGFVPVGSEPWGIALADFDSDEFPDLVVTNSDRNASSASILTGNGDGTFTPRGEFPTGPEPTSVDVADFDGDGNQDFLVANADGKPYSPYPLSDLPSTVSLYLGNGDGSFGTVQNIGVGVRPYDVAVGDFNRDNHPDFVTANSGSGDLSVRLGVGDGTFGAETRIAVGLGPGDVEVADFNNDGIEDLAAVNVSSGEVSLLAGAGDGTFGPPANLPVGDYAQSLDSGDFNNDGNQDLVVANSGYPFPPVVWVFPGNGDGSFGPPAELDVAISHLGPWDVTAGDLDADGNPDIVTAGFSRDGDLTVILGRGDGTFGPESFYGSGYYSFLTSLALGDFDRDGRTDFAAVASRNTPYFIFIGLNQGPYSASAFCFPFEEDVPFHEFTDGLPLPLGDGFQGYRNPAGGGQGTAPYTEVTGGILRYRGGQGSQSDSLFIEKHLKGLPLDWTIRTRFRYETDSCGPRSEFVMDDPGTGFRFEIPNGNKISLNGIQKSFSTEPGFWYLLEIANEPGAGQTEARIWVEGSERPELPSVTAGGTGNLDTLRFVGENQCGPEARVDYICFSGIDCNDNGIDDGNDISAGTSTDCNGNAIPDDCEYDGDLDGMIDGCDSCPEDPRKSVPGSCGCGLADADTDGDGLLDCEDNCPRNGSVDQSNFDGDAGGDACDPDDDGDLSHDGIDCANFNPALWGVPTEVLDLMVDRDGETGWTVLTWGDPVDPGATAPSYDLLRSAAPGDFVTGATCVETGDNADNQAIDDEILSPGDVRFFLLRGVTACGVGSLGADWAGMPRAGRTCP